MIQWLQSLLSSAEFWTAVGSIATFIAAFIAWRSLRQNVQLSASASVPALTPLKDEEEFVKAQEKVIQQSKFSITLCLHTIHSSSATWKAKRINEALLAAQGRGLTVRIVTGQGSTQLSGAYEIVEQFGIDLRLVPELVHSDLRFLQSDGEVLVLGFADASMDKEGYFPSHAWASLNNTALSFALEREFRRLWHDPTSKSLREFCVEYIPNQLQAIPMPKLSKDLGLPVSFVNQFYHPNTLLEKLRSKVIVFHGKAGSGKSTLIRRLSNTFPLRTLDLIHFVLPLVYKYGNANLVGDNIKTIYDDMLECYEDNDFHLIETGSDFPDYVLPKLFSLIHQHGRTPLLVHCQIGIDEARNRNQARARPVPTSVLLDQDKAETSTMFKDICKQFSAPIITVNTAQTIDATFSQILAQV